METLTGFLGRYNGKPSPSPADGHLSHLHHANIANDFAEDDLFAEEHQTPKKRAKKSSSTPKSKSKSRTTTKAKASAGKAAESQVDEARAGKYHRQIVLPQIRRAGRGVNRQARDASHLLALVAAQDILDLAEDAYISAKSCGRTTLAPLDLDFHTKAHAMRQRSVVVPAMPPVKKAKKTDEQDGEQEGEE